MVTEAFLHPLLSLFAVQTAHLYFMMVEMNILGRIYYNHEKDLGWFVAPKRRDRDPASR